MLTKQNQVQDDIRDEVADDLEDIYGSDPEPPQQTYEDTYGPVEDEQGFGGGSDSGSGSSSSDSKDKKIVCTEMYRQTQLDDWQRTIKLWYLFQKKYLSETHQKGYHFLFKPFVKEIFNGTLLCE